MAARVKISQNVDILAKVYLVHLTLLLTARVKISQNVDILAKVYLVHLTLLWLQGSKSVKMLIYMYLPRYI